MNANIEAARTLLQQSEFTLALEILASETDNKEALYYRSLVYRYFDRYDRELTVLAEAFKIDQTNAYINKRLSWHKTPWFERLVPRQPLYLPAPSHKIPSADTLAQMCFVTTSSGLNTHFRLLVQQIESIKATQHYKNIPICVLDAGLTTAQKKILEEHFEKLTIKVPTSNLSEPDRPNALINTAMEQAFMNEHFPGYRFYMWLANDAWIQSENSIHDFLYNARIYGAGLVLRDHEPTWRYGEGWTKINAENHIYPQTYDEFLNERHYYTWGAFCIDAKTDLFRLWQQALTEVHKQYGFQIGHEKITLIYAAHKYKPIESIPPLDHAHCFNTHSEGLPVLGPLPHVLYVPSTLQPIGIIHFDDNSSLAAHPIIPFYKTQEAITSEGVYLQKMISQNILAQTHTNKVRGDMIKLSGELAQIPTFIGSCHYRTWPTEDKKEIQDLFSSLGR